MRVLTEDEVIDAVIGFLKNEGWTIESRCTAQERGEDIVASRDGDRLVIEAKGAGSSKPHTNRYGLEFSKGQVFDHVAKAILKALRLVGHPDTRGAIAFPDNDSHHQEMNQVHDALQKLDIPVFWVSLDGKVRVEAVGRQQGGE